MNLILRRSRSARISSTALVQIFHDVQQGIQTDRLRGEGRQTVAPGQSGACRDVCVLYGCIVEHQSELLLIGMRGEADVVEGIVRRGELLNPDFDIQVSACQGTNIRQGVVR